MRYLPTFTLALFSTSALYLGPASADASIDELRARLEKAEKQNLILKAEKIEKENLTIKAEALEAENAALQKENKFIKSQPASTQKTEIPKPHYVDQPRPLTKSTQNKDTTKANEQQEKFDKVDRELTSIPKDDKRRDLQAVSKVAFDPNPVDKWDGAYIGINAGYNVGTNQSSYSSAFGPSEYVGRQWTNPGPGAFPPITYAVNNGPAVYLVNSAAASLNNAVSGEQSGFVAGGQVGYNKLVNKKLVLGLEADFMGTAINGFHEGYGLGSSSNSYSSLAKFYYGGGYFNGAEGRQFANNSIGSTAVNAGVNWMGTVRGRFGYLITPDVLLYTTGGLTYGNVYAKVSQMAISALSVRSLDVPGDPAGDPAAQAVRVAVQPGNGSSVFMGNSSLNKTLVGWNLGGGMEWSFEKNWSLKAEAIYWNLGTVNVATSTFGSTPVPPPQAPGNYTSNASFTSGQTSVNYQGIIARAGLNYHFRSAVPPALVAKY